MFQNGVWNHHDASFHDNIKIKNIRIKIIQKSKSEKFHFFSFIESIHICLQLPFLVVSACLVIYYCWAIHTHDILTCIFYIILELCAVNVKQRKASHTIHIFIYLFNMLMCVCRESICSFLCIFHNNICIELT